MVFNKLLNGDLSMVVMIIITFIISNSGDQSVSIAQTSTVVSAATCANVKKELNPKRDDVGHLTEDQHNKVQVVVKCIPAK